MNIKTPTGSLASTTAVGGFIIFRSTSVSTSVYRSTIQLGIKGVVEYMFIYVFFHKNFTPGVVNASLYRCLAKVVIKQKLRKPA